MKPVYTLYIYNDAYNITFIQLHLRVKDRQHQSRGGSDFPFVTQEPKGVEHRVIYQMKGNIYLYPMIQ